MDWSNYDGVETVPGRVSGVPVLKGSRVPADTVVESAELGETAEQIAFNYDLKLDDVRRLLAYAAKGNVVSPWPVGELRNTAY
jgi:uncharacterized protein (DUF433 family)